MRCGTNDRGVVRQVMVLGFLAGLAVACSDEGGAATTSATTVVATTAAAATTTTPPTTAPPATTAPATPAPVSSVPVSIEGFDAEQTAVAERTIEIFDRSYRCLALPNDCDISALDQDYTANSPLLENRVNQIEDFRSKGWIITNLDKREMWPVDVQVDANSAVVNLCDVNAATVVSEETGDVVNDETARRRWLVLLERTDAGSSWLVFDGQWVSSGEDSSDLCGW